MSDGDLLLGYGGGVRSAGGDGVGREGEDAFYDFVGGVGGGAVGCGG